MNTSTLDRPPVAYEPGRTLAVAIGVAIVLEAGLGLLLLNHHSQPIPRPVAPLRVTHIVTIADAPPEPAPAPAPAPPIVPPVRHEVQHAAPAKPHPSLARPKPAAPRETPAAPAPAPAPVPAAISAPTPLPAPAQPTLATPPVNHAAVRRGVVPLTRVEPDYPKRALADNVEGTVVADLTIEQDGHVSAVRIVSAKPPGLFEHEAEKALRQWKFSASDSGIVGEVELNFTLN
jgi:periplasmic protein TonB